MTDRLPNYVEVDVRVNAFYADFPDGSITTAIISADDRAVLFRAEVRYQAQDERAASTGYAEEIRGSSPVNRTSAVENSETSAVGRALANLGYAGDKRLGYAKRPSREEMAGVERKDAALRAREQATDSPQTARAPQPAPVRPANGSTAHPAPAAAPRPAQTAVSRAGEPTPTDRRLSILSAEAQKVGMTVPEINKLCAELFDGKHPSEISKEDCIVLVHSIRARKPATPAFVPEEAAPFPPQPF